MTRKVLIIGLDGATFDVINPLIEEGWMPNLRRLIENGASGALQSVIPPVTGPAWLSLATGLTPGRTGVYDFVRRKGKDYRLRGLSSAEYAGRAVWDYLSQAGKRVAILNYPLLYPPYEVNGLLVGGIGCGGKSGYTFPRELEEELDEVAGGHYERRVKYHNPEYDDTDLFLRDLNRVFDKHVRVTEYLLTQRDWDLFWAVFSETDWLQHRMWKDFDLSHPLHEEESCGGYIAEFKRFWSRMDEAIGHFQELARDETNVIILSDHGFGANDQRFKLNAWLEREGYLVRKKAHRSAKSSLKGVLFTSLKLIARALNLHKFAHGIYKRGGAIITPMRGEGLFEIDFEESQAFDPGHSIPLGGLYLNDRLLQSAEHHERLSAEITERLRRYGESEGVEIRVYRPEDIYGTQTEGGPDLLIAVNDWRCALLKDQFDGDIFEYKPLSLRHTGSHRLQGILIAAGPTIARTSVEGARLWDIAPTVLYSLGEPIPNGMEGRVLETLFTPEFRETYPIRKTNLGEVEADRERGLSDAEEADLEQRLRDLGYM